MNNKTLKIYIMIINNKEIILQAVLINYNKKKFKDQLQYFMI